MNENVNTILRPEDYDAPVNNSENLDYRGFCLQANMNENARDLDLHHYGLYREKRKGREKKRIISVCSDIDYICKNPADVL